MILSTLKHYGTMALGAVIFFAGTWTSWNVAFNAGYMKGRLTRIARSTTTQAVEVERQGSINPFGQSVEPQELESILGSTNTEE